MTELKNSIDERIRLYLLGHPQDAASVIVGINGGAYTVTSVAGTTTSTNAVTALTAAVNAVPSAGGTILLLPGTYNLTATWNITASNITIKGSGKNATYLQCASTLTGSEAINCGGRDAAVEAALTANANAGEQTVQMTNANGALFAIGNYVLLKSTEQIDSSSANLQAGEIKTITNIQVDTPGAGTTTITFEDVNYDGYTTANTAELAKINMATDIVFEDLTFINAASSNTTPFGDFLFKWIDGLTIRNCEYLNGWTGLILISCINFQVNDYSCYNIQGGTNTGYGLSVACASQNGTVHMISRGKVKHSQTTQALSVASLANANGIPRNITFNGCVSVSPTGGSHYNTHEPGENICFVGCVAIGGLSESTDHYGFYIRTPRTLISGCSIQQVTQDAIFLEATADGTTIVGNNCNIVYRDADTNGGRFIDAASGTIDVVVSGNYITGCARQAIICASACHDWVITGNRFIGNNTSTAGAAIHCVGSNNWLITGNSCSGANSKLVITTTTSDSYVITGNRHSGATQVISSDLVGTAYLLRNNIGAGLVTETIGTASILNGTTSIAVTHGLSYTPSAGEITITPTENPTNTAGTIWVDTITSTQFTVNCENDPGASNLDFAWSVRRV